MWRVLNRVNDRRGVCCPVTATVVAAGWLLLGAASDAGAQEIRIAQASPSEQKTDESTPSRESAPEATPVPVPAGPLPGPTYKPLRQDDDFSYLDGPPGSYQSDFFDPIKWIHLTDDLTLSLGGEIRGRLEAVTHKRYGGESPTQDTFFLHRYYYHADFRYRKLIRLFVQGVSAAVEDRDGTPIPNPSDHFDFQQLFADVRFLGEDIPLTLRVGRQELQYGKQRLVSPLDWANVRRSWDGAKVFWQDEDWNLDAWWVRPVQKRQRDVDNVNWDQDFYGFYAAYKGIENHGIDAFFYALRDEGDVPNANLRTGDVGDLSLYTMGGRFWGKTPIGDHCWDYDTVLAGQWGKAAGDTIQAWMWSGDTGYTLANCPWKPRIGIGLDYASGDDDPFDDIHGTFNQMFPLGHAYFGYLDQIGRQNLWAQNVNLTVKPHQRVTSRLAWHTFWTDKNRDALYHAGGAPVRRSPRGNVGDEIGHELDFTLNWKVDPHASLLFGYSHMWASDFITGTGSSEDPDLFYLQYTYKF